MRIIVGYPAGLAPDIVARLVAQPLSERLGQQFVIENRPGAGTNIATEAVVRAPPDGSMLLQVTSTNAVNETTRRRRKDCARRDARSVQAAALGILTRDAGDWVP